MHTCICVNVMKKNADGKVKVNSSATQRFAMIKVRSYWLKGKTETENRSRTEPRGLLTFHNTRDQWQGISLVNNAVLCTGDKHSSRQLCQARSFLCLGPCVVW